jgi:hypothetical protein
MLLHVLRLTQFSDIKLANLSIQLEHLIGFIAGDLDLLLIAEIGGL